MEMDDCIIINQLELMVRIGVPLAERMTPQRVTVSLRMVSAHGLSGLGDDVGNTVDYAVVADVVRREGERKERGLIETLAEDIAARVLEGFPLKAVEVDVRKYVLPGMEHVGVRIWRERGG